MPYSKALNKTIAKLQHQFRVKNAYKKYEQATGINIPEQSQKNLLAMYSELRSGRSLPEATQKRIRQEKKHPNDILTPCELQFFKKLIETPLWANHASFELEQILQSKKIYSADALKRLGKALYIHTPKGPDTAFTFYSYSYPSCKDTVNFLAGAPAIFINMQAKNQNKESLFRDAWTGGHNYAYVTEECSNPVYLVSKNRFNKVYTSYKISYEPLISLTKTLTFETSEGTHKKTTAKESEISYGRNIQPFHVLKYVEFLRHLDPTMRESVLNENNAIKIRDDVFSLLNRPGVAELHVPEALDLSDIKDLDTFVLEKAKYMDTDLLLNFINKKNHIEIEKFCQNGLVTNGYYFNTAYKEKLSLLNIAVLNEDKEMVQLLVKYGANPGHRYVITKSNNCLFYPTRSSLQDAIESKNEEMIQTLIQPNCDKIATDTTIQACPVTEIDIYTAIKVNISQEVFTKLIKLYQSQHDSLDKLLLVAVYYENIPAMQSLINAGADPNAAIEITQDHNTSELVPLNLKGPSLCVAAENGCAKSVEFLLNNNANPNGHTLESGIFYREGKGYSPLLEVIRGICGFYSRSNHPYECDEKCLDDYLTIINLLIAHGADQYYLSGNGKMFVSEFKNIFKNFPVPADSQQKFLTIENKIGAEPAIKSNVLDESSHVVYALVTAKDKNDKLFLLMGQNKNGDFYRLPGGNVDYKIDSDRKGAAINLTGLQTGYNLSLAQNKEVKPYLDDENEEDLLEIHSFTANQEPNKIKHTGETIHKQLIDIHRNYYNVDMLRHIAFIDVSDIIIDTHRYQNIDYPICYYKNKPLSLSIGPSIAKLLGRTEFDNPEVEALANKLEFSGHTLLHTSVKTGDIETLKELLNLRLDVFLEMESCLIEALEDDQFDMAEFLINKNLLSTPEDLLHFFTYHQKSIREDTLLKIYNAYHGNGTEVLFKLIQFACNQKSNKVLRQIILNHPDEKTLSDIAWNAANSNNFEILRDAFSNMSPLTQTNMAKEILKCQTILSHEIGSDIFIIQNYLKMIDFLLSVDDCKRSYGLLNILSHIYETTVKQPAMEAISKNILTQMIDIIQRDLETPDRQAYGVYIRLKLEKHKLAAERLKTILEFQPAFKLLGTKDKDLQGKLLHNHHHDRFVKKLLIDDDFYLRDRIDFLVRAIKVNDFIVAKLILETSYNSNHFDINLPNNDDNTLLQMAIELERVDIVKLLIVHGAKVDDNAEKALNRSTNDVIRRILVRTIAPKQCNDYHVFMSCQAPHEVDSLDKTGDVDYTNTCIEKLHDSDVDISHFNFNDKDMVAKLFKNDGKNKIFHLMLNAPKTGFGIPLEFLNKLRSQGVKIVVTALEFAKYDRQKLKHDMLKYFDLADKIIFLDENDKNQALQFSSVYPSKVGKSVELIKSASVLNVPPTISEKNITTEKQDANIMCFGMLRKGKGFAHVLHLAELLKESKYHPMCDKEIYIVGSIQKSMTRRGGKAYDATLYKLLCALYPTHKAEFKDKSPEELSKIYQSLKSEKPALPIRLFLDATEEDVKNLFMQTEYTFYPAYRGATLRNSSICTSLAFGNIIYSHTTDITPNCLSKDGIYNNAMVLFDSDDYHSYAQHVYDDILAREKEKNELQFFSSNKMTKNDYTRQIAKSLLANELSTDKIIQSCRNIYRSMSSPMINAASFATKVFGLFFQSSNDAKTADDKNRTETTLQAKMS